MISDSSTAIASSARRFFSGTLLSRLTGLGREIVMAASFGTLPAVAAFWMAFRFAHLLRRLFGEGGLHVAFVPHFETLRKEDPGKAALFFSHLSNRLTTVLLSLVVLVEILLGAALFMQLTPGSALVIRLTMILLPALIFISLYALNTSLLGCQQTFFLPSAAPVCLNLMWIGAVLLFRALPPTLAMERLAMVIVFAFAAQWLVTVPQVYSFLKKHLPQEKTASPLLPILRPFALALIGVAAVQVNSALDALFARAADPEGPAILWYALRLQQLPLALLGVGLTSALLPPMTRALQNGEITRYRYFLHFALQKGAAFLIPITGAIFALGFASVNLVYGRGAFTETSTLSTACALWAYGSGLLPMTFVLIFAASFYARKNYKIPSLLSVATVALNIFLNALFVYGLHLGTLSVALATTLTASLNAAGLYYFLRKEEGSVAGIAYLKMALYTLVALASTLIIGQFWHDPTLPFLMGKSVHFSRNLPTQLWTFLAQTAVYFSIYGTLSVGVRGIRKQPEY